MIGFGRGDYFNGQVYGEMIVSDAEDKKRRIFQPDLNYEKLVEKIARWLEGWLMFTMPRPGELMDLLSDAFLLVMKAKRKQLTMENYYEFMEGLRSDVIRYMEKQHEMYTIGFKTNITTRKVRK